MAEDHGEVIDLLTEALQAAGQKGLTKQDVLPAVTDWTASLALIMGGEPGVLAVIERLRMRVEDWKAGTFPAKTEH